MTPSHLIAIVLMILKIIGIALGAILLLALLCVLGIIVIIGNSTDNPFR